MRCSEVMRTMSHRGPRLPGRVIRASLGVSLVMMGSLVVGSGLAGATSTWSFRTSLAVAPLQLVGLSCSSTGLCLAVGSEDAGSGVVEATLDGGATWLEPTVMLSMSAVASVSCTAAGWCAMAGVANDGGPELLGSGSPLLGWGTLSVPSGATSVEQVSCWAPGACVVSGVIGTQAEIWTTLTGGSNWVAFHPRGNHERITALDCKAEGWCLVGLWSSMGLAGILRSESGGTRWAAKGVPPGTAAVVAVSCGDSTRCLAVGASGVLRSTDGGTTWIRDHLGHHVGSISDVSCPSSMGCVMAATLGTAVTTDAGASWSIVARAAGTAPTLVSCADLTGCVTMGKTVMRGQLGRLADWTSSVLPTPPSHLGDLMCPVAERCVGVGGDWTHAVAITSSDGGQSWATASIPTGIDDLATVSCGSATTCLASGTSTRGPVLISSLNGGQAWVSLAIPAGLSSAEGIVCVTSSTCALVGIQGRKPAIWFTRDAGATWTGSTVGRSSTVLSSISCSSVTTCMAVGVTQMSHAVIVRTADGGLTWATVSPAASGPLRDVACTDVGRCVAVGIDAIARSTNAGSTWSIRSTAADAERLLSVACDPTGRCVAAGWSTTGIFATASPLILRLPADASTPIIETNPLVAGFVTTATCANRLGCLLTSDYVRGTMVLTDG